MKRLFEQADERLRGAETHSDLTRVLDLVAAELGFSSALAVEFDANRTRLVDCIDTITERMGCWKEYLDLGLSNLHAPAAEYGRMPMLLMLEPGRLANADPAFRAFIERHGFEWQWSVPAIVANVMAAAVNYVGQPRRTSEDERTMLVQFSQNLIGRMRLLREARRGAARNGGQLTPRELSVLTLGADGLTSPQIGRRLGITPRTVDQHFENAALKLGTRNRVHTIAEVMRERVID